MKTLVTRALLLVVLAVSAIVGGAQSGWAQKVTAVETLISTASTGDSTPLNVEFYNSVSFTVTMSSTGTVQFKVSGNGTAYSDLSCLSSDNTNGTPATSTTSSGVFQCNVAAMQKVKATVSANGGTILVEAQASTAVARSRGGAGGGEGGAPTDATYWTGSSNGNLSAEINLGALGTGLVINTAGTPSIYAGQTCTNQVVRVLGASGAATCVTITSAYVDSSILTSGGALGTPSSGTATNLTGTAAGLTAGTATVANSGDSATSFFSSGTIEDARLPSSMADKVITGSLNIPNSTSLPGTCAVGNIYMDTNATSGQRLYLCESTNTWALQGDGGGGGGTPTAAAPARTTVNAGNSPYTAQASDWALLCDTTAAGRTITLPAATTVVYLKVKNLGSNTCTINRAGSDTIDGGTSAVLRTQYHAIDLISDGTSAWSVF
jgi:hypothetical protein